MFWLDPGHQSKACQLPQAPLFIKAWRRNWSSRGLILLGLQCRLVKETSGWTHKKETLESERAACSRLESDAAELAGSDMAAKAEAAQQDRQAAADALQAAKKAVHAAECELAGAEAGDGRDESNRSMQERLADLRNELVHNSPDSSALSLRRSGLSKLARLNGRPCEKLNGWS